MAMFNSYFDITRGLRGPETLETPQEIRDESERLRQLQRHEDG